jgi:hypothetical protein
MTSAAVLLLEELHHRDAADGRVADERHHVVAVAAERDGGDVLHGDAELPGDERREARGVEHAGLADDAVVREARDALAERHHRVERVRDHDDEGVRGVLLDALGHRRHDLRVHRDEVVAAHARLAGKPGRHDDDVRALDVLVAVRALELHVEAVDRRGLGDVEGLALGQPLDDVEQDHVAELAERAELSEDAADLPAADECNLRSSHFRLLPWVRCDALRTTTPEKR